MTKLGLISDLHGDLAGFQTALALFQREGVEKILCAGDIVDRGGGADEIVRLFKHHDVLCIKGNHEHSVLHYQARWRQKDNAERLKQLGRIISDETVAYLQALPNTARLTVDNQRILIAHGAPWHDLTAVLVTSRPTLYQRLVKNYGADTDLMILGHTHEPMNVRAGSLRLYNPGSVYGVTKNDSHTCATLDLPAYQFKVFSLKTGEPIPVPEVTQPIEE